MAKTTRKRSAPHRVNTHKSDGSRSSSREVAPAKRGRPRQQPLRGMENVRIRGLDDAAASIAEIREQMNALHADEKGHLQNALKLMRKHNRTSWRAAGVELMRVSGEEKLRVRTSKEKATAEVEEEDGEHVEVQEDEQGEGEGEGDSGSGAESGEAAD